MFSGVGNFTSAYVDGIGYTITDTNTGQSIIFAGANNDSDIPQAWLNCLFFDEQKNPTEGKFVAQRVSEAATITPFTIGAAHEKLSFELTIEKAGYLYINVTHDEQQNFDVYFDDLKITHIYSDIVAGSDYYPFGLAITDRQITREDYRYGYQGQFVEKDDETNWNHFELREYDPIIGRWTSMDPYNEFWSPYIGMGNDPVNLSDPDGGSVLDDVHYNSQTNKYSVVKTNQSDRIFIDGKYVGGGGADGSWRAYAPDASVFSSYNFAFYNSFGGSLRTDIYDNLWKGASSTAEQTALFQAKIANKDATILYATLATPVVAIAAGTGIGELISAAPAIASATNTLYWNSVASYNALNIVATQAARRLAWNAASQLRPILLSPAVGTTAWKVGKEVFHGLTQYSKNGNVDVIKTVKSVYQTYKTIDGLTGN